MALFLYRWLMIPFISLIHPFFVSVTEIEYSSSTGEMGISAKIFTDDFEEGLKIFSKSKVDLKNGNAEQNKKLIAAYFKAHLKIAVNNKAVNFELLGFENDHEATWCYFSAQGISSPGQVELRSDILYDYKKEQVNIIHFIADGKRSSNRLSYPEETWIFSVKRQ